MTLPSPDRLGHFIGRMLIKIPLYLLFYFLILKPVFMYWWWYFHDKLP